MKLRHIIHEAPSGGILLVVLAILFTLCAGPANSAPESGTITIVVSDEPHTLDIAELAVSTVGKVMTKMLWNL
jgi:hypothetical protein